MAEDRVGGEGEGSCRGREGGVDEMTGGKRPPVLEKAGARREFMHRAMA